MRRLSRDHTGFGRMLDVDQLIDRERAGAGLDRAGNGRAGRHDDRRGHGATDEDGLHAHTLYQAGSRSNIPRMTSDPEKERRAQTDRRQTPRGGRRPGDPQGYSPLILVADDDADNGARCVAILSRLRFAVAPAHSVEEAVKVAQSLHPNLIVARLSDETALREAARQRSVDPRHPVPRPQRRQRRAAADDRRDPPRAPAPYGVKDPTQPRHTSSFVHPGGTII